MPTIFSKVSSLAVKIPILFASMLLLMMGVFLWVMDNYGNNLLFDVAKQQVRQNGESMVSVLGRRLTVATSLVNSIANAAENLPADEKLHHQIIKPMVDHDAAKHYIAGGGVWPEPFAFEKGTVQRSFFWGRNQLGELEYFDDYNDPEGTGYHNEEWYVPSKLLKDGQVYWSRSYMDPYSFESMVTVTAPMYRDGSFYGAVTIDLSLDGISELLATESQKFGGYAYALDRNGTFISYPDESVSKTIIKNEDGTQDVLFTSIGDASKRYPEILDVTSVLINTENISRLDDMMNKQAQQLADESYQINLFEAHRIVSTLKDPLKSKVFGETFIQDFMVATDPILKQASIINVFHIPNTYWKVITVTPVEKVTATSDNITQAVITAFMYVIAFGLFIGLIVIHFILIRPIKSMHAQVSNHENGMVVINGIKGGEFEELANEFNKKNMELMTVNSQLEKSVEKAEQATMAKTHFLANMSHEIRTPMNGVNGMLSLLEKSNLTTQQQHFVNVAKSSSDSLLVLINDILDFSKIESGKLDIESIDFNIREFISDFFTSMIHLAEKKDIELILDMDGIEQDWVKGDPGRIRQILTNLISNAIKFTNIGSVLVKISIKDVNDLGLILYGSVKDTGIGIKSDKLDILFDSFSQVDASTTREYGGTGLGLSISKQLCELMQGSISVKSKVGAGSNFEFTLTLGKSEKKNSRMMTPYLRGKVVLLQDKNDFSERVLRTILENRSAQVLSIIENEDVCDAVEFAYIDYVFLDFRGVNDLAKVKDYIQQLKTRSINSMAKVIGMKSVIDDKPMSDYLALGCDQVISKPVTDESIDNVINLINDNNYDIKERVDFDTSVCDQLDKNLSILLVEDNLINQEVALGMLEDLNLTADVVNNGQEAFDLLAGENCPDYQIVLMDCQMPVMDGYEATRNIRRSEGKHKNIAIIAMTANAMKGDEEKCLASGMSDYISKPINGDVLKKKLLRWAVNHK